MAKTSHLRPVLAAGLIVLLLLLAFLGWRAFFCPMAEGVSVGGVDISGLSAVEARKILKAALEESLYQQVLSVHLPEETLVLTPQDSGVSVKLSKALRDALHLRQDSPEKELSLHPYLTLQEDSVQALLEDYAARYDTALSQPTWCLEGNAPDLSTEHFIPDTPCQTLTVTMGVPELHLFIPEILGNIRNAYADSIALCAAGSYEITPEVQPEALPDTPDAAAILREVGVEPVNDSVDRETFGFVHGSYGLCFDAETLQQQIAAAAPGESISMPMTAVAPEILGEDAWFQDVLGSCETKHTDNENRNINLRLLCQALDGYVLQPGEEFSFNGVVGERTAEKGYLPAPAYSGDRLVNSYGGGVCQGSTTLYNCVLLADLEVVFRVCHGAKVGYVPLGLDAAVNWLTTDFRFRNNWNFPVKLQAEVSDGYVKMKILGTDEKDYYIKMETGSGEDDVAWYARSFKCKYDKATDQLLSRDIEAYSTYYKEIG